MIAIDTNILARFITRDNEKQCLLAKKLILSYKNQDNSIFINDVVLCELCWLLRSGYKYTITQVIEVLFMLLDAREFTFSNKDLILEAVLLYKDNAGDFADYLIYAINNHADCSHTYSFDEKMINCAMFTAINK